MPEVFELCSGCFEWVHKGHENLTDLTAFPEKEAHATFKTWLVYARKLAGVPYAWVFKCS